MHDYIEEALRKSADVKLSLIKSSQKISDAVDLIADALLNGNKLLIMGNGGSAADAQHIAGEFVGRFKCEREPMPAIALSTDTSIITAIGNDYGFENIFSRQIEALANKGDIAFAISTSGNSKNVIRCLEIAKRNGIKTVALLGGDGGKIKYAADLSIVVPSYNTPRIQEAHITIGHIICSEVEKRWTESR